MNLLAILRYVADLLFLADLVGAIGVAVHLLFPLRLGRVRPFYAPLHYEGIA
jgi:hypothetical protein